MDNGVGRILRFWPVAFALLTAAATYGVMHQKQEVDGATIKENSRTLVEHEAKLRAHQQTLDSLEKMMAEQRSDIKEILRRTR